MASSFRPLDNFRLTCGSGQAVRLEVFALTRAACGQVQSAGVMTLSGGSDAAYKFVMRRALRPKPPYITGSVSGPVVPVGRFSDTMKERISRLSMHCSL